MTATAHALVRATIAAFKDPTIVTGLLSASIYLIWSPLGWGSWLAPKKGKMQFPGWRYVWYNAGFYTFLHCFGRNLPFGYFFSGLYRPLLDFGSNPYWFHWNFPHFPGSTKSSAQLSGKAAPIWNFCSKCWQLNYSWCASDSYSLVIFFF